MPVMLPSPLKPLLPMVLRRPTATDFSKTISQAVALAQSNGEILKLIENDQILHAKEKKLWRMKDQEWERQKMGLQPLFESEEIKLENIQLGCGRERMPPMLVLVFLYVRGLMGSLKSEQTKAFIAESLNLALLSQEYGLEKTPAISTILDNLNLLCDGTLRYIMQVPISEAKTANLDDFKEIIGDSTRIFADATWPTEAKTIVSLAQRIFNSFAILRQKGIKINLPKQTLEMICEIQSEAKSIALESGKKGAADKRKKRYRKMIKQAKKLADFFCSAVLRAKGKNPDVRPSEKASIDGVVEWIGVDIHNLLLCAENAKERVLKGKPVSSDQKVLGIADDDAVIVPKGMREPVYGYKPQICRSLTGFIIALELPLGAASDKEQMRSLIEKAITATSQTPSVISLDDGYTNDSDRTYFLEQGIEVVSFSGANGKKIIPKEQYDSKEYQAARNDRSFIESSISKLKGFFGLDRFTRRGIKAVTQELLTAAIYQNMQLLQRLTAA